MYVAAYQYQKDVWYMYMYVNVISIFIIKIEIVRAKLAHLFIYY